MQLLKKYFQLKPEQELRFERYEAVFMEWNNQINLISRKDTEHFYERHVLHSLAIDAYVEFKPGTRVIDVGTGGGFPGLPLAISNPEVEFVLMDSIGKKMKAVQAMADELGLSNVTVLNKRSNEYKAKFDFVVSRAVSALPKFHAETRHLIDKSQRNPIPNGILYLKGGDLKEEIAPFRKIVDIMPLSNFFEEEFFLTKSLVFLPV